LPQGYRASCRKCPMRLKRSQRSSRAHKSHSFIDRQRSPRQVQQSDIPFARSCPAFLA
jgi:hypothetical protein